MFQLISSFDSTSHCFAVNKHQSICSLTTRNRNEELASTHSRQNIRNNM